MTTLVTLVLIALGLAMDAFAVSVVSGALYRELHVKHAFRMAFFFGLFQAVMPIVGFLAGLGMRQYVEQYSHWIAFGLLTVIGIKMIIEAFEIKSVEKKYHPGDFFVLMGLSVATSIDALVVGVTLSLLAVSIFVAAAVIGVITFLLSLAGVYLGKRIGHFFEVKLEVLGGLILIGMGVKILLQNLLG